ncbi:LacI family DNA-binding transcriptional regulator [Auraticoccus monumenti]|uniref:LacI family DNA-binding transcriptional regulator n=1 Tax=Auraticoccus monumenti TaxID=675864 RepID=UPI0018D337E5|nr:LacI family DNA-binding transcriptional regulator [Auraticoccus monumenti]
MAELAGVSHQTVSRYLRKNGGLLPGTVERIDAAVATLGYRPNLLARSMRTRRTDTVAVLVPSLLGRLPQRELSAACAVAHDAGYRVEIVMHEGGPEERQERALELLDSRQVEAVLSLAPLPGDGPPPVSGTIVAAGDHDDSSRGLGALADGSTAGEIVEHLASLGHRHLLHVAGPEDFASARNRRLAYEAAVERLGLVSHGSVGRSWSPQNGYDAITALPPDSPVTAVLAANDEVAMGVIRGALERGWDVPGHLSVFGWDDRLMGRFTTPSLSTVAVDREQLGAHAMRRLVAALRDEPEPEPPGTPLNTILVRESTAGPRSQEPA